MDTETWLIANVVLVGCMWVPYVLDRAAKIGIAGTIGNPTPENAAKQSPWALRAKAAHANAVENLVVYAPLALVAMAHGASGGLASTASALYFGGRLVHFVAYAAGVPGVRTLAFTVGFIAQLALAAIAMGLA